MLRVSRVSGEILSSSCLEQGNFLLHPYRGIGIKCLESLEKRRNSGAVKYTSNASVEGTRSQIRNQSSQSHHFHFFFYIVPHTMGHAIL